MLHTIGKCDILNQPESIQVIVFKALKMRKNIYICYSNSRNPTFIKGINSLSF